MSVHTRADRPAMTLRGFGLVLIVLAVLLGCVSPPITLDTPKGFAEYSDSGAVRMISPEGVVLRVRTVPNDPVQSLEFWSEALERHLTESGYLLIDRTDLTTASGEAVLMEWLAPVSEDDWIYLTAIGVMDTQIAIVEAAGPTDLYEVYRLDIRESLESLRVETSEP